MTDQERIVGLTATLGDLACAVSEYEDLHLPNTTGRAILREGLVCLVGLAAGWLEHLDAEKVGR